MKSFYRLFSTTFEQLKINPKLNSKLAEMGIVNASPAQKSLIPVYHSHADLLLKDETGSGKTFGLCISILNKPLPSLAPKMRLSSAEENQLPKDFIERRLKKRYLGTLFIVPSRELALQVQYWIQKLDPDFVVQSVFAGVEIQEQIKALKETPSLLIGTPKRLWELYEQKAFDISQLQTLVVDEIDRMIEPLSKYATVKDKFNRKIHPTFGEMLISKIISERKRQTKKIRGSYSVKTRKLQLVVSSATANSPLRKMLKHKRWVDTSMVILDLNTKPPKAVEHVTYYIDSFGQLVPVHGQIEESREREIEFQMNNEQLSEMIANLCHKHSIKKAMIFTPSTFPVSDFVLKLQQVGLKADRLSNVMDFTLSKKPFQPLEDGTVNLVVATEPECRGLDSLLDHVISIGYIDPQQYLHVSGRVGRYGVQGTCITLLPSKRFVNRHVKNLKLLGC